MSDSEDLVEMPEDDIPDEGGDDLFGDSDGGADDIGGSPAKQDSDREELDSGDDDDESSRRRRADDDRDAGAFHEDRIIESVQVHRHRAPKPDDGVLRSLRVPKFLRIFPETYDRDTFEPTDRDVDNARSDNPKAEVRSRRDAATGKLQSNSLVHRWSDGTMTISVGDEHFELNGKSLAPVPGAQPYRELQDAHYYAAAVDLSSNHYMMVGHVGEQYTVRPGRQVEDDALAKLAERMQAASRGVHEGDMIVKTTRDPELQKREAEQAEKERMKAQRRRETQAAKMDGGGRYARGAGGGLSINDLEGGRRGAGGSRKRGAPGSGKARRRPEYDSDDDLPSGARRAGDDYDLGDDFIAPSDDDASDGDGGDMDDLLDDDEDEAPRRKRQRTVEEEDDGADEDVDEDTLEPSGRSRQRRQVIDDDEED